MEVPTTINDVDFNAGTRFLQHQSFVRGMHRWPVAYPRKGPVMWIFDDFVVVNQNDLLKYQSSCWMVMLDTVTLTWRHSDISVSYISIILCFSSMDIENIG